MRNLAVEPRQHVKVALREYYERKYKLYKANNNLPVTEEEFEALKGKVEELREIKDLLTVYENMDVDAVPTEGQGD